jgi:hypothetical protein
VQETLGRWVAAAAAGVVTLRQAWQQQRTAALAQHTARRKELLEEVQQEHKVGATPQHTTQQQIYKFPGNVSLIQPQAGSAVGLGVCCLPSYKSAKDDRWYC